VIPLINFVKRRIFYIWTTSILTVLFASTAVAVSQTYAKPTHFASMIFYALAQFMFNLGPNTLTYVIAAEIFPTEFRGTCFGIAAAAGKIGAIIIRPITKSVGTEQKSLVVMLSVFAAITFAMVLLVWLEPLGIALPKIQKEMSPSSKPQTFRDWLIPPRLMNMSLEEIAPWPITNGLSGDEMPAHQGEDGSRPQTRAAETDMIGNQQVENQETNSQLTSSLPPPAIPSGEIE
jgi:PHS family inorganic phosphate transporter-like MFS transporter